MDTCALRLFVLAAERLNITAAGRALGLSPAMSSGRISKLEQELGVQLMHRTTRRISLSLEGMEFLPYAREILAQEDTARAALGHGEKEPTGTLRFAAPSSFAQLHIMPILPAFREQHPGITLDLRLSDTRIDLIEGSFDLALRSAPLDNSSLKGRKLSDETRVLCAAPDYLAARGTPQNPCDLAAHDMIAWATLAPRQIANRSGETWLLDPKALNCRLVINDGTSQRIATIAGAGISFNSLWSVSHDLEAGRLIRVLPGWHMNDNSVLWIVYPRSNVLTPKTRIFMDFMIERLGNTPAWYDLPS